MADHNVTVEPDDGVIEDGLIEDGLIVSALSAARKAARVVRGTTSPNPPVGAAIISTAGELVGVGATEPPGGRHAEIVALDHAGEAARGAHVVVTLEPCNHQGRTGPCSQALINAGVASVHYVHADPNVIASGGAQKLREAGIAVHHLGSRDAAYTAKTAADCSSATASVAAPYAVDELAPWLRATAMGRVHITAKIAQSIDGFSAAVDGTSQWITGAPARQRVHRDRSTRDAIIIGTGTALADNPSLTARYLSRDGEISLYEHQPRRIVIGSSDLSGCSNLQRLGFQQFRDIPTALTALWEDGCRDVLVEGGPRLLSSFFAAGYVDAVQAYVAPLLLGQGRSVLASALGESLDDGMRLELSHVEKLGDDLLLTLVPGSPGDPGSTTIVRD